MWRGTLSPRKVDVLIRGLPHDSATRASMNGAEPIWTRTDFILADLVDATNSVAWIGANKDVARKDQSEFPEPYPRPGIGEASSKVEISAADLIAFSDRTRRD